MAAFPRYAIYFVPRPDDALYRFGAAMIGYDAFEGRRLAFPADVMAAVPDWEALTADPRKYGFHATLKAPLPLAQGCAEADLAAALGAFASQPREIPAIVPVARALSGFTAIVPEQPVAALNKLADDCVEAFDRFRATLTTEERARRRPERLSARQVAHLDRWGYPYVFEDFRFHMTITGRLAPERSKAILDIIQDRFAKLQSPRLAIDQIALFRQDNASSRFAIIGRWPLTGGGKAKFANGIRA
jgi:putative phosphonate metabolism protein